MQQPSSDNRASAWSSLYTDCRDWCRFAEFRGRVEGISREGEASDGTASWQQVRVTGQRDLARECGREHHRPAGLYAKMAVNLRLTRRCEMTFRPPDRCYTCYNCRNPL